MTTCKLCEMAEDMLHHQDVDAKGYHPFEPQLLCKCGRAEIAPIHRIPITRADQGEYHPFEPMKIPYVKLCSDGACALEDGHSGDCVGAG